MRSRQEDQGQETPRTKELQTSFLMVEWKSLGLDGRCSEPTKWWFSGTVSSTTKPWRPAAEEDG